MKMNQKQNRIIKSFAQAIQDLVAANNVKKRTKRDLAADCKGLQIASATAEFAGSEASEVAGTFNTLGVFGAPGTWISSGIAMTAYASKFATDISYIELGCDDIPFNEIKEILDERFTKLDEAVDRNYNAILKVDEKVDLVLSEVQRTRIEMHEAFAHGLVSSLKTFVTYYDTTTARINGFSEQDYIARIDETMKFLNDLENMRKPGKNTLYDIVHQIIYNSLANPKSVDDNDAWLNLGGLYYAAQTYVSVVLFLVKQYTRIADYYYNVGDLDHYNINFNQLQIVYESFKDTLIGKGNLINKIIDVMEKARVKNFILKNVVEYNDLRISLNNNIESLKNMKAEILNMKLSIFTGEVDKLNGYFNVDVSQPFDDWMRGGVVSYALQYKTEELYSKIGEWVSFQFQRGQANPTLRIPVGPEGRHKLVFRKFNNNKAQLVGVIDDKNVLEFHDINRDLYNAASYTGMNEAATKNMIENFLQKGVDMKARFEHGRTAIHAAAANGNQLIAKILLDKNPSYVNLPDDNGYTPLHVAAEIGDEKFIAFLMQKGADVNAQTYSEKLTALHIAVRNGYSLALNALLESENINIYARDADGSTPLHLSISRGISLVKFLKDKNFVINAKTAKGLTILHLAVINKDVNLVKDLVKYSDLQVNSVAADKYTPLHFAVLAGDSEMVQLLLQYGADMNAVTSTNMTPLHIAVSLQQEDIVNILLSHKNIKIDSKVDGSTPLHVAVGSGLVGIAEKLLGKGASIQAMTKDYATPLHIACMHKRVGMVEFLLKNSAKLEEKAPSNSDIISGFTPLLAAASIGNLDVVQYLIGKGADINAIDSYNDNILIIAARNGRLNVVRYLEDKFDITRDPEVLRSAIQSGNLHLVKYLIDEKRMNWNKKEFFDVAVKSGHSNIVNYFIFVKKYKITCDSINNCEYTELAFRFEYLEMLELLSKNEDKIGSKILDYAGKYGQTDLLDYYLDANLITIDDLKQYLYRSSPSPKFIKYIVEKANITLLPDKIISITNDALVACYLDLIKYVLKDVDINTLTANPDDLPFVHNLVFHCSYEYDGDIYRYLIDEKRVNINPKGQSTTPLYYAVTLEMVPTIKFLISRGASLGRENPFPRQDIKDILLTQSHCDSIVKGNQVDIATLDKNSKCIDRTKRDKDYDVYYTTPLILAIFNGNLNVANELIDNGANLHLTDDAGNTPLHIAVEKGYLDLTNKLIRKGVDVTVENKAFKIPLILAYDNFNKPIIDALNAANERYSRGKRSIQESASPINVVKYLKNHGCHIIDASEKEGTPLCLSNLNGKQGTTEFKNPLCLQHNLSLGLLLLQNFLDKKYPLPRFTEMDSEKSRTFALEITFKFEKILRKAVKISQDESSSLDFYKLFREIEVNIRNEKFSNIPKILVDFVNDACTNEKTAESMVDKIGKWFSKV